ncbi:MAG: hypothetical protein JXO49_00810 [Deltaproteobacteria bacterium]|nr:hypothetical protein [Candidatus Anaeroferrophillus wilburensis]MBN2887866.1 hypothetical protein [Deltaproteobacteria bacterium]
MMRKPLNLIIPFTLVVVLTVALMLPGISLSADEQTLATIDSQIITGSTFEAYLELFKGNPRYQPGTREAKEKLLQHLINRTILLQYAEENGYADLEELSKHQHLSREEKETLILRRLLTDLVSSQVAISQTDIDRYLQNHPQLTRTHAEENIAAEKQQEIFHQLMNKLKKKHTITIYQENL